MMMMQLLLMLMMLLLLLLFAVFDLVVVVEWEVKFAVVAVFDLADLVVGFVVAVVAVWVVKKEKSLSISK